MLKTIYTVYKQYGIVFLIRLAFSELHRIVVRQCLLGSYSQHGEGVVHQLLRDVEKGYFVDVGAHEPVRNSNTYYFYRRGWRGVCIDADPECIKRGVKQRSGDVYVHCGIGLQEGLMQFYRMSAQALSTFSREHMLAYLQHGHAVVSTFDVPIRTLSSVFTEYIKPNQPIHFLNVDVEGLDWQVLQSNDWERYLPWVICVEDGVTDGSALYDRTKIQTLLSQHGYILHYQNKVNSIFVHKKQEACMTSL